MSCQCFKALCSIHTFYTRTYMCNALTLMAEHNEPRTSGKKLSRQRVSQSLPKVEGNFKTRYHKVQHCTLSCISNFKVSLREHHRSDKWKIIHYYILKETSKPPVNKTHFFQYNLLIVQSFEMIFDTVISVTNIRPFITV